MIPKINRLLKLIQQRKSKSSFKWTEFMASLDLDMISLKRFEEEGIVMIRDAQDRLANNTLSLELSVKLQYALERRDEWQAKDSDKAMMTMLDRFKEKIDLIIGYVYNQLRRNRRRRKCIGSKIY